MGRPKSKGPNKAATTIYIAPKQRLALQRLARRLDVSMGILLREGAALVLAKYDAEHKETK